jgi:cbb3-type cytochrome oxidase cytochrome c subunit
VTAATERVDRYATDLDNAEIQLSNMQTEDLALTKEKDGIEKPWKDAQAALDKVLADKDKARMAVEGLRQKFQDNQWRNGPVIDFISPTIKIDQVVLKDIHDNYNFTTSPKVDRCTTCHLGIDLPDFAKPDLIQKHGIEPWMQAHPALPLISGSVSPHKKDKVGCTVCHAGVGWSTDFARAAHTPVTPEEEETWTKNDGWYEAEFIDFPMLPLAYVQGQCFKCHKQGMYYPPQYVERLDHGFAFGKDEKSGEAVHYQRGPDGHALGPLEAYGPYSLPPAPPPTKGTWEEVAAGTKSFLEGTRTTADGTPLKPGMFNAYEDLKDDKGDVVLNDKGQVAQPGLEKSYQVHDYGWRAERFDRGTEAITAYGCQGCHKIQDFGDVVGYDAPPRVAPDLRYIADKAKPSWIERWIRAPETYRIDTPMPSFYYFVPKDKDWTPERTADGRLRQVPVMDAHLTDPKMAALLEGQKDSTPRDLARLDVEILAIKTFLLAASGHRDDPKDPGHLAIYDEEPPPGNVERGRKTVGTYGCAGCHILPEVEVDGKWVKDDGARFGGSMLIAAGSLRAPRLTSLGSKLKDRKWLNAWLNDPKHYSADTRMPNMRFQDLKQADGTVIPAEQIRADVVDYLLSFKDPEFDALPETTLSTQTHLDILADMYEEFFGKGPGGTLIRKRDIEGTLGGLKDKQEVANVLRDVGERVMGQYGCFGCHAVAGHEKDQPIGTELTREGVKDLHMLDFGRLAHGTPHDKVSYNRWTFIRTKITYPRVWELGKVVRWNDRLRMPKFNFRMDDGEPVSTRASVAGMVLGFVDEPLEPLKDPAKFHPDEYQQDIIAGRRLVQRYGCNNCHTIEGKEGILVGWITDPALGTSRIDGPFAPPNLFAEGARVQQPWLMKFLTSPFMVRPRAIPHMPKFGFKPEQAAALARYFDRLSGDRIGMRYQPDSTIPTEPYGKPVTVTVKTPEGQDREMTFVRPLDEVEALFNRIACNKCHLPLGSPGADPADGGVAPSFELSRDRLQRDWVRMLLNDPQHLIYGTNMTQFWKVRAFRGVTSYGRKVDEPFQPFLLDLRDDPKFLSAWNASADPAKRDVEAETRLAERQMDWIADFITHHYRPPEPQPEAPR